MARDASSGVIEVAAENYLYATCRTLSKDK